MLLQPTNVLHELLDVAGAVRCHVAVRLDVHDWSLAVLQCQYMVK